MRSRKNRTRGKNGFRTTYMNYAKNASNSYGISVATVSNALRALTRAYEEHTTEACARPKMTLKSLQ